MKEYKKYMHLERLGHRNCRDLETGEVYVFPKLDGTNASAWWMGGDVIGRMGVGFGSRNRQLSLDKDNGGFMQWGVSDDRTFLAMRAYGAARGYVRVWRRRARTEPRGLPWIPVGSRLLFQFVPIGRYSL